MLLKLANHHGKNSLGVDKLIHIDPCPDSLIFETCVGRRVLKDGVQVDPVKNTPSDIIEKFGKDYAYYEVVAAYREAGTTISHEARFYLRKAKVFKIDYDMLTGELLWKRIEKLIDASTPRDQDVVKPGIVGDRMTWMMTPEDVPSTSIKEEYVNSIKDEKTNRQPEAQPDVYETGDVKTDTQVGKSVETTAIQAEFSCYICNRVFETTHGLHIHKIKAHAKEKVGT